MNKFSLNDLNELIRIKEYPCISIYLPTHVTGIDLQQNHIKLKNLLSKCQSRVEAEWAREKVQEFFKPGTVLLNDTFFWSKQSEGLALFISPGFSRYYNLSVAPPEKNFFGNYYDILPLLPVILRNKKYYILLLRQKGLKLFMADFAEIREVELHNVPQNIDEVLQYDIKEESMQWHTMPSGKTAGTSANFHGLGDIPDESLRKKNVDRYLKEVAKGLDRQLAGQTIPLVLAGVEYEQAIYRQCSGYKNILSKGFSNNFGKFDIREIHQLAQKVVQPFFSKEILDSIAIYKNLISSKKTSSDIREILQAVHSGRVNSLLLDVNKSMPGKVDNEFQQIEIFEKENEKSEDLLNLAAVYALKNNAKVYAVSGEELGVPIAAVFRY